MKQVNQTSYILRIGNNCLFLEKGIYESLLCALCKIEVKGLEHFMFKCPKQCATEKFSVKLCSSTGENFRLVPFNFKLKKIFILDLKKGNNTLTNIIFDMNKAREKLTVFQVKRKLNQTPRSR